MLRIKNPSHPSLRIAQGQLLSLTELEKNICFLFFSVLFLSFSPFIMFLQRFIISWCLKPEGLSFPFLVHSKKVNMSKSVWQRWHSCTKSITFTLMQSLVDVLFLVCIAGNCSVVEDFELQRQVICALNSVLYEQLQYKGNECDYYNPLNSYIHQVDFPEILYLQGVKLLNNFQIILLCGIFSLIFLVIVQVLLRRTGIPISLSVLYMTLAQRLGVQLEPVNFPNHFLLRWCQKPTGYSFHLKKKKFRSSYWLKFKLSCTKFMEGKAWRRGINNQDPSFLFCFPWVASIFRVYAHINQ